MLNKDCSNIKRKIFYVNSLLARAVEDFPYEKVVLTTVDDTIQVVTSQSSRQRGSSSLRHLKKLKVRLCWCVVHHLLSFIDSSIFSYFLRLSNSTWNAKSVSRTSIESREINYVAWLSCTLLASFPFYNS